jgi:very-short-patch-repair endonuclease
VIRFWDNEVIKEMDEVLNVINRALTSSDVDRKTSPGR